MSEIDDLQRELSDLKKELWGHRKQKSQDRDHISKIVSERNALLDVVEALLVWDGESSDSGIPEEIINKGTEVLSDIH